MFAAGESSFGFLLRRHLEQWEFLARPFREKAQSQTILGVMGRWSNGSLGTGGMGERFAVRSPG
jgi:hypothetical protein